MSDSTGGVVSGVGVIAAEDGLGSGSGSVWDSALGLDVYLGFERAIGGSFIKVGFERY